jgi:hypothetical protein
MILVFARVFLENFPYPLLFIGCLLFFSRFKAQCHFLQETSVVSTQAQMRCLSSGFPLHHILSLLQCIWNNAAVFSLSPSRWWFQEDRSCACFTHYYNQNQCLVINICWINEWKMTDERGKDPQNNCCHLLETLTWLGFYRC